jgi:hypothetical protein
LYINLHNSAYLSQILIRDSGGTDKLLRRHGRSHKALPRGPVALGVVLVRA